MDPIWATVNIAGKPKRHGSHTRTLVGDHNVVPVKNPMSIRNRVPLSIILTVAHIGAFSRTII